jgi:hypothetical protein
MTTPLATCGKPYFFELSNPGSVAIRPPDPRRGVAVRLWARSLSGMQKEALVTSSDGEGAVWRLSSDEGPYLNGGDVAPCPLSFLTTGMVSSYMEETRALAGQRGIVLRDLTLVQDNFYTMEGSALKGTMTGGALPVELEARIDSDASDSELQALMADAIGASPVNGLMRRVHESRFTLTHNGREIPLGRVASLEGKAQPDPGAELDVSQPKISDPDEPLIVKLVEAAEAHSAEALSSNKSASLLEHQKRTLHVRGTCRVRTDGIKEIRQELFKPYGSTFRYLSEESLGNGGRGRAPDAASYVSAGIGFCFMTQFGRYASIVRKGLQSYRIVQDTHFTRGGASGRTGKPGDADAVETHVYLETSEDDDFARTALDMAEQTCFLHALCRTSLKTRLKISRLP